MKNMSVGVTEGIYSTQEWTSDPDKIVVSFSKEFIEKAEKCVAFMQTNQVNCMTIWWAFGYEFYIEDPDDGEEGEATQYVEFEPEYRVDGCHAKIYKDGDIQAVLEFKYSNDELYCPVGTVEELKNLTEALPAGGKESE